MYQRRPQIQWSMTTCSCEIAQSPHLSTECSPRVQWTVSFVHLRLKSQSGERSAPKVMSATMAWKSTITWKRIVCKLKSLFRSKIFISLVMALVQIMNLYVLDVWDVCGALVSIYTERGSMKCFEVRLFLKIRLTWKWESECETIPVTTVHQTWLEHSSINHFTFTHKKMFMCLKYLFPNRNILFARTQVIYAYHQPPAFLGLQGPLVEPSISVPSTRPVPRQFFLSS